jgi:hypothetical protein
VVASAEITYYAAGASSGSRTLTIQRPAATWDPGTLNWTNQPGVLGGTATVSIGTLADGDPITFTGSAVTTLVNAIVTGAANYGFRLITDSGTAHRVYGFDSDHPPQLRIVYYIPPSKPTGLKPTGGAVATSKPTLTWPYVDPDNTDLDAVQVQIDSANNFVSGIDFDSGWVTSAESELDLTRTDMPGGVYGGIANAATIYWRSRVRDADGGVSPWADPVSVPRQDQGTLAIVTPSATTIKDATPTITWSLTGATQAYWQVRVVRDDNPSIILHDTGKRRGTATAHTLPPGVIDDESITYRIIVRTWDNVVRVPVPGFPTYVVATKSVTLADGAAGSPSGTTATQDGETPAVIVEFTRTTPPDTFTIVRDGRVIKALLDPADALVSGTTYRYYDWTAAPLQQHSYQVRAVVSGDQSPKSAAATVTTQVEGVWLVDPSLEDRPATTTQARWIRATGTGVDDWARSDTYVVHRVLGAAGAVKITSAMGGTDGGFKGAMFDGDAGVSVETQLARINKMLEHPDRTLRLIGGHLNFPVVVADLSPGVHQLLFADLDKATVSWRFWQTGELGFNPGF